jgi:hypothetical protein
MTEPDRRAVLGLVALERNDLREAGAHLAWAACHGGRAEDYLACIEALVRAGDLGRARETAAALRAAHPGCAVADRLAASLGSVTAPAGTGAEVPA